MKVRSFFFVILAILAVSCQSSLRSGDLLFQINDPGGFVDAIEASTSGSYSHVGILEIATDGRYVIEADPEKGVARTPLEDFLSEAAADGESRPRVRVFRVRNRRAARRAVMNARQYLGRKYDFAFLPGMETVYCSELVHASYLDRNGQPLFKTVPMSFHGEDGQILPFWTEYYDSLGLAVPEGLPGTNPNDLSRESILYPVRIQF